MNRLERDILIYADRGRKRSSGEVLAAARAHASQPDPAIEASRRGWALARWAALSVVVLVAAGIAMMGRTDPTADEEVASLDTPGAGLPTTDVGEPADPVPTAPTSVEETPDGSFYETEGGQALADALDGGDVLVSVPGRAGGGLVPAEFFWGSEAGEIMEIKDRSGNLVGYWLGGSGSNDSVGGGAVSSDHVDPENPDWEAALRDYVFYLDPESADRYLQQVDENGGFQPVMTAGDG